MNRHQVLTGAANTGDKCFAVGSVEGTHFTAYGTGTTIVILASDFQRVQIIPCPLNGSSLEVTGISCCSDLGKIAASYGSAVCIFEPMPLSTHTSSHKLDYHWYHTGTIEIEGDVLALKWNMEGTQLLLSGDSLELWQNLEANPSKVDRRPSFFIADAEDDQFAASDQPEWTCVWRCALANPVSMIQFSSDGLLFATAGENDRMVKVWYEDRKDVYGKFPNGGARESSHPSFSFIYLAHPRAVTGFSWRRTTKYMQKGTIANMLVTSCKDNICRIWCETVLPEDGLLDTQQLEPKDAGSPLLMQRNKKRIIQRIHQIRHILHKRKKGTVSQSHVQATSSLVGTLPEVQKVSNNNGNNGVMHSFHFHLAASINLNSDVPLIGSLGNVKNETFNFVIHWLDNKEFHATLEAEKLIDEISHKMSGAADQKNLEMTPTKLQNGKRIGLPMIGSDPSINSDSVKKHSAIQKTKSYAMMLNGRTISSPETTPFDPDASKSDSGSEHLEQSVERLIQSWNQGSDMLYGVHPLDGSLVVWVVDHLDESAPGTFNQVKVSLSAMLPNAFPVFDALTMQPNIWLYCDFGRLGLKSLKLETDLKLDRTSCYVQHKSSQYTSNAMGTNSSGRSDNDLMPNVLMVTKHTNGSINMWQVSFAENSQFATIVNVSHVSRVSGHRFRTDSSACHPVLPLLLTTSHSAKKLTPNSNHVNGCANSSMDSTHLNCSICNKCCSSELILWRVAPVGPLSKSGGLVELARINSSAPLAFSKIAWFPTLLPASCRGQISNSPSALFVASDGNSLRIYQAVLDGRLILAEQQTRRRKPQVLRSFSNGGGTPSEEHPSFDRVSDTVVADPWNIVSLQSTSRPGCIIDFKAIDYEAQDWHSVQLIHVFPEPLVCGAKFEQKNASQRSSEGNANDSVDERFYLVVIEKMDDGSSLLQMWRIDLKSIEVSHFRRSFKHSSKRRQEFYQDSSPLQPFTIVTEKVCSQTIPLPNGISITTAAVAAGHLSSSSIYPACFAPYLLSTACTDGLVRFWCCSVGEDTACDGKATYEWKEWKMITKERESSEIQVEGRVLSVSSAYSGRIAIAHQSQHKVSVRSASSHSSAYFASMRAESAVKSPTNQNEGLFVSVYECESTGGANWMLEDVIEIPSIVISDAKVDIDMSLILENGDSDHSGATSHVSSTPTTSNRLPTVPSSSTIQSIRRFMSRQESTRPNNLIKHRAYLDWVSTEDGSHILTVSVGSKILLYTATSAEACIFSKLRNTMHRPTHVSDKAYTMTVSASDVRWIRLRTVELSTADGMLPLLKHMTWVRNGILVVGTENEMHVYSQWKLPENEEKDDAVFDTRKSTVAVGRSRTLSKSMSGVKLNASIANLTLLATKKSRRSESTSEQKTKLLPRIECGYMLSVVDDCGLFEAARIANPCLPQYHPKQLLELLNSGKMCCVRLIMSHLLRCLDRRPANEKKPATFECDPPERSSSLEESEEPEVNFLEVTSIPPLPLYVLLEADPNLTKFCGKATSENDKANTFSYDGLFHSDRAETTSLNLEEDGASSSPSEDGFGPLQARRLAKHLEHMELPGLSSLDQVNLLTLSESLTRLASEGNDQNGRKKLMDIIDDCGLRFLFAAQQHVNLASALPSPHGEAFRQQGLSSAFVVWAFHSKSKKELLDALPWKQKDEVTWEELKQFGIGWWLNDSESLTQIIEKVAKTTFQATKDPVDVALYYIALKKKNVLAHLFRIQGDSVKSQFFKNDFSEDRWRKAALKNAFRLLGKQQFQRTAAFFLLAGAVSDAIKVCLTQLKDIQLALVILRLYEGGPLDGLNENCKRLLQTEILGSDDTGSNYDISNASHDPFLRSMAQWMLNDYKSSLDTLLIGDFKNNPLDEEVLPWKEFAGPKASIFNVYSYLRVHPQVIEKKFPGIKGTDSAKLANVLQRITSAERQLYFQTAHSYFRAGCPLLALDILSNMPTVVESVADGQTKQSVAGLTGSGQDSAVEKSNSFADTTQAASVFDLDWSQPVTRFDADNDKLDLSFGPSSDEEDEVTVTVAENQGAIGNEDQGTSVNQDENCVGVDIMAQQLSFIACMKILVTELSTLATGFEVDGGQLRYQLYVWLEKEMDVLNNLCCMGCDYDDDEGDVNEDYGSDEDVETRRNSSVSSDLLSRTLHETMLAEKSDLEAKLRRMERRRKWLEANEQVLGTLLGYSVLHGSSASGLASMQMELLLLLQELQQTKTPQQLRSPIPLATTLPLLSASIASAKTVVSDPIRHLQSMCQDLLHTLIEFKTTPAVDAVSNKVYLIRDLSLALSACIYQCLCDIDSLVIADDDNVDVGLEGFMNADILGKDSCLMAGARKRSTPNDSTNVLMPTSQPAMWPGVSSLVTLMNQKRDEDVPKPNVLLMEAVVAVFMSLLSYALASYDAIVLYRLIAHPLDDNIWPLLFGGGRRKSIRVSVSTDTKSLPSKPDHNANIRSRYHRHVLGASVPPANVTNNDRATYKEHFVPPQMNMISYFLAKVRKIDDSGVDYDSSDSMASDDDDNDDVDVDFEDEAIDTALQEESKDDFNDDVEFRNTSSTSRRVPNRLREHLEPNSYSWCLMRYAVVKCTVQSFKAFLPKIGMDFSDLPMRSPLVHSVVKNLEVWEDQLRCQMDAFSSPPTGFIPGCSVDASLGVNIVKYSTLTNPNHTPFLSTHYSALPAKRLWHYLVTRESLQDVFIRYVFGKSRSFNNLSQSDPLYSSRTVDAARIVYKDQEAVNCFSTIPSNKDYIVLATHKDLIEMSVGGMLNLPVTNGRNSGLMDVEVIRSNSDDAADSDADRSDVPAKKFGRYLSAETSSRTRSASPSMARLNGSVTSSQNVGPGGQVLLKRLVPGVKRIAAHPQLPYYLTGMQDGSLRLWEVGRSEPVAEPQRLTTPAPKPTKVLFNSHGNKFGVSDVDGKLGLWQLGHNLSPGLPFMELKCHSRGTSDFVFVGSSSLLATAGSSSDNCNVCLWDTLLPRSKSLIKGFHCSSDGCSALAYAPYHQAIISGGKKGELYIFDVRQRQLRHTFVAHNSAIKCISFDPAEDCFATGSADGEIKVWGLTVHNLLYSFPSDRPRSHRFRSSGVGISDIHLGSGGQLFSSSTDGSLKIRLLTLKHAIVNTWQNDDSNITHF